MLLLCNLVKSWFATPPLPPWGSANSDLSFNPFMIGQAENENLAGNGSYAEVMGGLSKLLRRQYGNTTGRTT